LQLTFEIVKVSNRDLCL